MVDVYLPPDDEVITSDDAETGVRTLLQNQQGIGFLGRMRARLFAGLLIDRGRTYAPRLGVPWIRVRRNMLMGIAGHPTDPSLESDGPCRERDILDVGSTTDHLDRIIEVSRGKLPFDARARRFAAVMSPLSLPEAVAGIDEQYEVYRDTDIEAVFLSECEDSTDRHIIRILARDRGVPADDVRQKGIVFNSRGDDTQKTDTFDIDAYALHLSRLRVGDSVSIMMDEPSDASRGGVESVTEDDIGIRVEGGSTRSFLIPKGIRALETTRGFVFGAAWTGCLFSRTSLCRNLPGITFVPWSRTLNLQELLRVIEPSSVHVAIARSRYAGSVAYTSLSSLFQTDDVSLSVNERIVIQGIIKRDTPGQVEVNSTYTPSPNHTSITLISSRKEQRDFLSLLHTLPIHVGITGGGKKTREKATPLREELDDYEIDFLSEPCEWSPRSALDGLATGCLTEHAGGEAMALMNQGHLENLSLYVNRSIQSLTLTVSEVRAKRDMLRRAEATNLADIVTMLSVPGVDERGLIRVSAEIKSLDRSDGPPHPVAGFRHLDVARWLTEVMVRPVQYDTFRGNEQTAFDADLANHRVMFQDRAFYQQWDPLRGEGETDAQEQVALTGLVLTTPILLDMLIETCGVVGLDPSEITSIIRNTRLYRPEEETANRIRRRIDMVKRARNRPEFREQNHRGRAALEKRLVDRVRVAAAREHTVAILHMLGALVVMLIRSNLERIRHVSITEGDTYKQGRPRQKKNGKSKLDGIVGAIGAGVHRIVTALLPAADADDEDNLASHSPVIESNIRYVTEDKLANGVDMVIKEDRLDEIVKPRVLRDVPWPLFRPLMTNLSASDFRLSAGLTAVSEFQRPFLASIPLIFRNSRRPDRYNVCCAYVLGEAQSPSKKTLEIDSRRSAKARVLAPNITTIVRGTTAVIPIPPVLMTPYIGETRQVVDGLMGDGSVNSAGLIVAESWKEDMLRSFIDLNPSFSDDALAVIAAGNTSKSAWSALASQSLARFEEMTSRVGLLKDRVDLIRNSLLLPTASDGAQIQEQHHQARLFLRSIIIPLFGRLSNNVDAVNADQESLRFNAIMAAHEPRKDVTTVRSSFAVFGALRSSGLLMLASGPLRDVPSLRSSVQLLMGVGMTSLWKMLFETGGGPLGPSIVKPVVLLCFDRLATSLKFARADETVTRLIQDQREDDKLRKIEIYKRILPDDVEAIRDLRLIKKDLKDWQQIERDFAQTAESAIKRDQRPHDETGQTALEIGALGAYPDDDRDIDADDGDQEMMDY